MASGSIALPLRLNSWIVSTQSPTGPGRFYICKVLGWAGARFPLLIVKSRQDAAGSIVIATFNGQNGANAMYFSDSSVTYDPDTRIISIDQGASAWAYPMIIYPANMIAIGLPE